MNKSSFKDGNREFASDTDSPKLSRERSADEVRYAKLWAEVELPKLLADRGPKAEHNKQR